MNQTSGRKEVKRLTGNTWVPVLVTDDDQIIQGSKEIAAWAKQNPGYAARLIARPTPGGAAAAARLERRLTAGLRPAQPLELDGDGAATRAGACPCRCGSRGSPGARRAGRGTTRQRTTPSLREYTDRKRTPFGNGASASAQKSVQQSPQRHEWRKSPLTPTVPSAPTAKTCARDERVDRERLGQRRTERDDPADEVGPALGEDAREVAAAALADDRRPLALALDEHLDLLLEPLHGRLRAVDVHADAGALGVVVRAPQPARHERRASRRRPGSRGSAGPAGRGRP